MLHVFRFQRHIGENIMSCKSMIRKGLYLDNKKQGKQTS
jgi:hypothetical protein